MLPGSVGGDGVGGGCEIGDSGWPCGWWGVGDGCANGRGDCEWDEEGWCGEEAIVPSAMVDAGGVGGAGAFGALASAEEEVVEEEVDITFLPLKPKVKEKKEKKKEMQQRK